MKYAPDKPFLLEETPESLTTKLKEAGQPAFRAKQVLDWVYKKFVIDPDKMTNLPEALRAWLKETFILRPAKTTLVTGDAGATQKLLLELGDKSLIETVLLRAPIDNDDDPVDCGDEPIKGKSERRTICISTQVGCAQGCKFCASGLGGFRRDLHAAEILAQLFAIIELVGPRADDKGVSLPFDNIVVMGMGEPLLNFDNLMAALTAVNSNWGLNLGARRITVSTSGIVPRIRDLATLPTQFRLAVSLHAATDEVRSQIMPVNRRYPLAELIPAVADYNAAHNRRVTFEYILIDGLNDTPEQADALIGICKGLKVHINAIPYNPVEGLPWKTPSVERQEAFAKRLLDAGISITVRREKGGKIDAACGQLRLKEEQKRSQ